MRTTPTETKVGLATTEAAVLALLHRHGPLSGYDLNKLVEAGVGYVWAPARSRLYAVLPRLEQLGYVRSWVVAQSPRPDKRLFRINKSGRTALRVWLTSGAPVTDDELLLRIFFGDLVDLEHLAALLETEQERSRAKLDEYREIERRIADRPEDAFGYATLRWGIARERARIRWAAETLAAVRERVSA